jgi:hypothetical protein
MPELYEVGPEFTQDKQTDLEAAQWCLRIFAVILFLVGLGVVWLLHLGTSVFRK